MSNKVLLLVAVSGLALAGYASAASAGLLPEGSDMGLGAKARCQRADVNAENAEALAACRAGLREHRGDAARHRPAPPGFTVEDGQVQGKWVSFTADGAQGALLDYTSKGPFADQVLFTSVQLAPYDGGEAKVRGPVWAAKAGDVRVVAFNAPNAMLVVHNNGTAAATVTYTLAEGLLVEATEEGIVVSNGDHRALLKVHGEGSSATLEGSTITVTLGEKGGAGFAIEGFPRVMHAEKKFLRHHAGPGPRSERGPPAGEEPLPPEAMPPLEDGA